MMGNILQLSSYVIKFWFMKPTVRRAIDAVRGLQKRTIDPKFIKLTADCV